jgi:hypothetical protein
MRMASLATAAAISLFVTLAFLCAAIFVMVLQHYGLVAACLAGAGVFLVVTLIAAGCFQYRKQQLRKMRAMAAKSAFAAALADPMIVASGFQVLRAIGLKRLLPVLLIGGVALGLMVRRMPTDAASE